MWSVLAESPAIQVTRIDVGGSTAGTQTGYNAYDARGGQNRVMIDGLVTTEGTDAIGVYVDYGAFDEISVGTASHSSALLMVIPLYGSFGTMRYGAGSSGFAIAGTPEPPAFTM